MVSKIKILPRPQLGKQQFKGGSLFRVVKEPKTEVQDLDVASQAAEA